MRAASISLLVTLVGLHVWLFALRPPGATVITELALAPPFAPELGLAWQVHVPVQVTSDAKGLDRSRLLLREDGKPVGSPHARHAAIRERGGGAFLHWGEQLWFSTTDGSNPNTNGRSYTVLVTEAVACWPHLLLLMVDFPLALGIGLWLLTRAGRWRRGRRLLRPFFVVAGTCLIVELLCAVLYRHQLGDAGEAMVALVQATLDGDSSRSFHGESVQYSEHHYLNYVLNPDFHGGVARQFERAHRIRATEPLRSRAAARWRVLALGGSTTYGEQIDDEADTWVHRLERRLRRELGPDVEVINGGVGGYNVLENTIHYITLLSSLEPDLVLLYVGINDVHPRLFGTLVDDYANYRVPWRSEGSVLPMPVSGLRWSSVYRLWYLHSHVEPLRRNGIGGLTARDYPPADTWAGSLARNGTQVYREHLRNLIRLLLAQGRRVAVLPQHFVVSRPENALFLPAIEQHNEVNRQVAEQLGVPFAQGLVADGAFAREHTIDHCHFTAAGSERMSELVLGFLRAHDLLPK